MYPLLPFKCIQNNYIFQLMEKRGKDINIKIWPDIYDYMPAMWPLPAMEKYSQENNINIDMQNIRNATSSGLSLLLINIINCIHSSKQYRRTQITPPLDTFVFDHIKELNFFDILQQFCDPDLFWPSSITSSDNQKITNSGTHSFPLYHLNFKKQFSNRRETVVDFVDWICRKFELLEGRFPIYINHLMRIFQEMAKNSADHTHSDAFCGLDFCFSENGDQVVAKFGFGDLGIGVNRVIAKFLRSDPNFSAKDKHLSLSDAYHYAFRPGITSRPDSGENRGLGMSMIFDIAKEYGIRLSVFDANSCGVITSAQNTSHAELRKVFYNSGRNVGFYYYGELELKQNLNEDN